MVCYYILYGVKYTTHGTFIKRYTSVTVYITYNYIRVCFVIIIILINLNDNNNFLKLEEEEKKIEKNCGKRIITR